jgi:hypothetical protein
MIFPANREWENHSGNTRLTGYWRFDFFHFGRSKKSTSANIKLGSILPLDDFPGQLKRRKS